MMKMRRPVRDRRLGRGWVCEDVRAEVGVW
jgi:hypothetical protein